VTVLSRYLAEPGEPGDGQGFDELTAPDGTVRDGWSALIAGFDELGPDDLVYAQREVARLLEDDNVTYTPSPASSVSIADAPGAGGAPLTEPRPWRLDPFPLILDDREWSTSKPVWCSGRSCWTRS